MNEFSFKTSKGNILESMMRNKEQAKLLREAINSPLGSTSRAKARKTFSIMNKLNTNNGIGGPGYDQMQVQAPDIGPTEITAPDSKGIVIFHKIPKAKITYGKSSERQKTHSEMLNDMRRFSFSRPGGIGGPGFKFGNAWDGIKPINRFSRPITKQINNNIPSGVGGPGYDGRGGPISWITDKYNNTKNAISDWWNKSDAVNVYEPPTISSSESSGPYIGDMDWNKVKETGNLSGTPSSNTGLPAAFPQDISKLTVKAGPGNSWIYTPQPGDSNTPPQKYDDYGSGLSVINKPQEKPWFSTESEQPWSQEQKDYVQPAWDQPLSISGEYRPSQEQQISWDQQSPQDLSNQNQQDQQSWEEQKMSSEDLENNAVTEKTQVKIIATETGKGIHLEVWEGTQGGQCGRFVNNYLGKSVFGDSFQQKMSNATRNPDGTLMMNPQAGDVAIFAGGDYGHVAVIESINPDGTLNIVESNADGTSEKITRRVVDTGNISGYYRPGGPTNLSTPQWLASRAVSENIGPAAFGLAQTENVLGGTLQELAEKNRINIWDKYNLDAQSAEVNRMSLENSLLPTTITDYIRGRDEYLDKTDAEISRYIDEVMKNTDMSDPINASAAKSQLNYLYTLRGRQNKSYIGYLNDAIEQHGTVLQAKVDKYKADLEVAGKLLDTANQMTAADFENKMTAFAGMYEEVRDAPLRALQQQELETKILAAQYNAVADATKSTDQLSLMEQGSKLKTAGYIWSGPDNLLVKGTDLVDVIGKLRDDPGNVNISDMGVVNTYIAALKNSLYASEENIPYNEKLDLAKEAMATLSNLAYFYEVGDPELGIPADAISAEKIRNNVLKDAQLLFGNMVSEELEKSGKIPEITESIRSYAPSGWFGRQKSSPNEEEFLENFKEKTDDSLDNSLAKAIYAVLERFKYDDGNGENSAQKAVESLLSYGNSTEDRSNLQEVSPADLANRLSEAYVLYYLNN